MTHTIENPPTAPPNDDAPAPALATSRAAGATAGFVAAGAALASGELLAGISRRVPSLLVGIFDVLVDYSPGGVVAWSRETFGLNQKTVTITGITIVALLLGAAFGVSAVRDRRIGIGAFVGFGLFGGWAAARSPLHNAGLGWLAGFAAIATGVAVLTLLLRTLPFSPSDATFPERLTSTDDRRLFIGVAGGAAFWAVFGGGLGRVLRRNQSVEGSREAVATRLAEVAPTAVPETSVVTPTTTLEVFDDAVEGISPLISPNNNFYRIDTAFSPPLIDVDDWSLTIKGMVDQEVTLTFDDILRLPQMEETVTLSCVSNEVGGNLVGNAVWTGVSLPLLLDLAGVQEGATQIVGRSVDGWTGGFPTEIAYDGRPAMLAITQNGEPLPVQHGFPARLVIPGLYGYVSATKWISEIELTTWDGFDGYWITRGWSKEGPIKTQSRIDVPRRGDTIPAGITAIAGVAWAGLRSVDGVEVQIDDGPWVPATLSTELSESSWRQWMVEWDATPGDHAIRVRATDGDGVTQTAERSRVDPDGATGHHAIPVRVSA